MEQKPMDDKSLTDVAQNDQFMGNKPCYYNGVHISTFDLCDRMCIKTVDSNISKQQPTGD